MGGVDTYMSKPIEERTHRREVWWKEQERIDPDLFKKAWATAREQDHELPESIPEGTPVEVQRALVTLTRRVTDLELHWS